jgi:general secretion pathway protein L
VSLEPTDGAALAVRSAVAAVLAGEPQGADAIAVAIDGSRAAVHRLVLPATAQKQLADVLAYELEAQMPFDLEGAVFDWRVLPRGDGSQLPIVATVARVEDVRARIELLQEALSQEPEIVSVGAFAFVSLAPFLATIAEGESVALVELGSRTSEVLILERGEPVFARTVSSGTDGLPATAERLARDLRVSFAAHQAQGGVAPVRVYLCGDGAFVSGAEGFLSGSLEVPVQLLPEPALDLTALAHEEVKDLPRCAKAVALALALAGRTGTMNLRRGPLAFERGFAWVRDRVPVLAGLAAVILVSFVFSAWARMHAVHAERAVLEGALGVVTKEVLGTEVTTAQEAQDLLSKEAALTDEDPMPHADAFDVMVRLSQAIPLSMKHDIDELDVQKGHVTVRGIVDSVQDAQSIVSTLSEDKCLGDVKIKSTTQAVGSDRQKYALELELRCPEDIKGGSKKKAEASSSPNTNATASGSGGK